MKTIIIWIDEAGRGPWAGPLVVGLVASENEEIFKNFVWLHDSKKVSKIQRENLYNEILSFEKSWKIFTESVFKTAEIIDTMGIREANRQAMNEGIEKIFEKILEKNNMSREEFFKKYTFKILIDGADNFIFDDKKIFKNSSFHYIQAKKKSRKSKNTEPKNTGETESEIKNEKSMWILCEKNSENILQFIIGWDGLHLPISAASIIAKVSRDNYMDGISAIYPNWGFEKNKGYGTKYHHEMIINYGINQEHRKSFEPIKALISKEYWL